MEKDNCYVLADGSCVSPLDCIHGDGLAPEDFIKQVKDANCLEDACKWIAEKAHHLADLVERLR